MGDVALAQALLHLMAVQRHAQRHGEIALAVGFDDIAKLRVDLRALQGLAIRMCGGENDGCIAGGINLLRRFDAGHRPLEANVHQHHIRREALGHRDRIGAGVGNPHHPIAQTLQAIGRLLGDQRLILDDQH